MRKEKKKKLVSSIGHLDGVGAQLDKCQGCIEREFWYGSPFFVDPHSDLLVGLVISALVRVNVCCGGRNSV